MKEYIVRIEHGADGAVHYFRTDDEIVRCKDCRYGYQFYDVQKGITDSWVECRNPNGLNRDVSEDGYCSYGERRAE